MYKRNVQSLKFITSKTESITNNNSAMAIGVFFRNDEAKLGKHGYPLKGFSTKMYWKSLKNIDINIEGIHKKRCSEEEILVCSYE